MSIWGPCKCGKPHCCQPPFKKGPRVIAKANSQNVVSRKTPPSPRMRRIQRPEREKSCSDESSTELKEDPAGPRNPDSNSTSLAPDSYCRGRNMTKHLFGGVLMLICRILVLLLVLLLVLRLPFLLVRSSPLSPSVVEEELVWKPTNDTGHGRDLPNKA